MAKKQYNQNQYCHCNLYIYMYRNCNKTEEKGLLYKFGGKDLYKGKKENHL